MNRTLTPRFGIWDLDALIQSPVTEYFSGPGSPSPFVLSIEGPVGSGKSTLALHLAAQFLQGQSGCAALPVVIMVSTDWRLSQAMGVWEDFRLDLPPHERQPYSSHAVPPSISTTWAKGALEPLVLSPQGGMKELPDWLTDLLAPELAASPRNPSLYFLDLSDTDAGDEWLLLERLLALLQLPAGCPGLVVVDSVPGMQTTSGERDSFGQWVASDERIGRLVKAAAGKCSLAFTTAAAQNPIIATRDEGQCDFIYRVEIVGGDEDPQRFIRLAKARGHQHSLGRHLLEVRSRKGYFSSSSEDPDNQRWICDYIHVTPSISSLSDAVKRAVLKPGEASTSLNAFGIRYLDTLLEARQDGPTFEGDAFGVRCGRIVSISGEGGTHKSEIAMAFARHLFADPARLVLSLLEQAFGSDSLLDSAEKNNGFWNSTRARWRKEFGLGDKVVTLPGSQAWTNVRLDESPGSPANQSWWSALEAIAKKHLALNSGQKNLARCAIVVSTRYMEHRRVANDIAEYLLYRYEHQVRNLTEGIKNAQLRSDWIRFLNGRFVGLLTEIVSSNLIYRRLSGRELSPAVALNAIRRCVEGTVAKLAPASPVQTWLTALETELQPRIRLVVDDLHAMTLGAQGAEYHEFRNLLNTYLRTRLVTSVLVETNPQLALGRSPYGRQEQEISIKTWRVRFESGDRVAIAVEPAMQADAHGIVRELRLVPMGFGKQSEKGLRLPLVDPDFELYANLPAGSPKLVPLEVQLYAETEAWTAYCEREEEFLRAVVRVPMPGEPKEVSRVINRLPRTSYRLLQDLCTLPNSANLPSTVVLQVDGFWALQRAGDLRNLHSYLSRFVNIGLPVERVLEDQFLAHRRVLSEGPQERGGKRRADRFSCPKLYESRISANDRRVDRVPLMWDMGFLLIDTQAWAFAENRSLPDLSHIKVKDVLVQLPEAAQTSRSVCNWRHFLGACVEVAKAEEQRTGKRVAPLALSSAMPSSMDCLVLEMWLSECVAACRAVHADALAEQLLRRLAAEKFEPYSDTQGSDSLVPLRYGLLDLLGRVNLEAGTCDRSSPLSPSIVSALRRFVELPPDERNIQSLSLEVGFTLQLYQVWLLLLEAFNTAARASGDQSSLEEGVQSVAVRHWYKTACATSNEASRQGRESIQWKPRGLPGLFVTRGDWYLGIAKGSRSVRLGELTLDALTDDTSNRQRLDLGIGLPVVRLVGDADACGRIPTALKVSQPYGWKNVTLGELRSLGGYSYEEDAKKPPSDAAGRYWLWRSEIGGYDWQSRPFKRWLSRVMDWSAKYRFEHQDRWDGGGGFKGYDDIVKSVAAPGRADAFKVVCGYESLIEFGQLCDDLRAELIGVTPAS